MRDPASWTRCRPPAMGKDLREHARVDDLQRHRILDSHRARSAGQPGVISDFVQKRQ